jgi:hypothetical protein
MASCSPVPAPRGQSRVFSRCTPPCWGTRFLTISNIGKIINFSKFYLWFGLKCWGFFYLLFYNLPKLFSKNILIKYHIRAKSDNGPKIAGPWQQSFIMTRIYSDPHFPPYLADLTWCDQTLDSNKSSLWTMASNFSSIVK